MKLEQKVKDAQSHLFLKFATNMTISPTRILFWELLHCRFVGELLIDLNFGDLDIGTLLPAEKSVLTPKSKMGVLGIILEAGHVSTDISRVPKAGPLS